MIREKKEQARGSCTNLLDVIELFNLPKKEVPLKPIPRCDKRFYSEAPFFVQVQDLTKFSRGAGRFFKVCQRPENIEATPAGIYRPSINTASGWGECVL